MTTTGAFNDTIHVRHDVFADVLNVRLLADEKAETYADVTEERDFLRRDQTTDRPVGLTVLSWWKRFGKGSPRLFSGTRRSHRTLGWEGGRVIEE